MSCMILTCLLYRVSVCVCVTSEHDDEPEFDADGEPPYSNEQGTWRDEELPEEEDHDNTHVRGDTPTLSTDGSATPMSIEQATPTFHLPVVSIPCSQSTFSRGQSSYIGRTHTQT